MLEINCRRNADGVNKPVILDLLPGFERIHGASVVPSALTPAPTFTANDSPGHRSWLGYFQSPVLRESPVYIDQITSRNRLGILVTTKALVSTPNTNESPSSAVEPIGPGLANAYILFVGRNATDGFILRVPDAERAMVEEIHTITVHRFQEELSAKRESPAANTVAWMNSLLTKLGLRFDTLGE